MSYEFTIIVPLYNEEENLLRVEQEMKNYLKNAPRSTCVLFVDDGSTDASLQLIRTVCSRNRGFRYLSFAKNYGLSAALKAGFEFAESPLVGYIDADLQTLPQDFDLLLKHIDNYDLVTGIRVDRRDSPVKKLSSKAAGKIRRLFTEDGMEDTGCPLKVIRTETARNIPMFNGIHRFLPAMVLLQQGRVMQIPVRHFPRKAGTPKFHLYNRIAGPLMACFVFLWMKAHYINYRIKESNG